MQNKKLTKYNKLKLNRTTLKLIRLNAVDSETRQVKNTIQKQPWNKYCKLRTVRNSTETNKLRTVWNSAESSWALSGIAIRQIKLTAVRNSAESSWALSETAQRQSKLSTLRAITETNVFKCSLCFWSKAKFLGKHYVKLCTLKSTSWTGRGWPAAVRIQPSSR